GMLDRSGMVLFVLCFQFAHEVGPQNVLDVLGVSLCMVERQVDLVRQEQLPQSIIPLELAGPCLADIGQLDGVAGQAGPAPADQRLRNAARFVERLAAKISQTVESEPP